MSAETLDINAETRAYQQMEANLGADGMQMLDAQLEKWRDLNERGLNSPLRESLRRGETVLPAGTLMHGMGMRGFDAEAIQGVSEIGIVSGELTGVVEDAETHGCADFFRVPTDMSLADYFRFSREVVDDGNIRRQRGERLLVRGVTFIVDAQAAGMQDLSVRDGYKDHEMSEFVAPPASRTAEDTAAILGGVPRGAIAGIVMPEQWLADADKLRLVKGSFPNTPIFSQLGVLQEAA